MKGRSASAADASAADSKAAPSSPNDQTIYRFVADTAILNAVLDELGRQAPFQLAGVAEQGEAANARVVGPPDPKGPMGNFAEVFKSPLTVSSGSPIYSAGGPLDESRAVEPRPKAGTVHTVLVLRSFRNMLDAVAQEQRSWDQLAGNKDIKFLDYVPAHQRHPVLRTDWSAQKVPLQRSVVNLSYRGRYYQITDPVNLPEGADAAERAARDLPSVDLRWNRDVFRLLIDLSAQVSVDITKFQRPLLELTQ